MPIGAKPKGTERCTTGSRGRVIFNAISACFYKISQARHGRTFQCSESFPFAVSRREESKKHFQPGAVKRLTLELNVGAPLMRRSS